MVKVLVIEDDNETAAQIVEELRRHGYDVDREADGPAGLDRASTAAYDLITLDRLLPALEGLAIVETLRRSGVNTPVLVLSAVGEVDERVRGLRAGGDDYLTKPFAFAELCARVDAHSDAEPLLHSVRSRNEAGRMAGRALLAGIQSAMSKGHGRQDYHRPVRLAHQPHHSLVLARIHPRHRMRVLLLRTLSKSRRTEHD